MIKFKEATRDLKNGIRKGETYLSFTGRDADFIKRAASKLRLEEEKFIEQALLMFIDKHGVCGVACNNGDA